MTLLTLSCSGDLGNYDYVELNEPAIEGVEDRSVLMFSRLTMTPQLGSDIFREPDYTFEWKVIDSNGDKWICDTIESLYFIVYCFIQLAH